MPEVVESQELVDFIHEFHRKIEAREDVFGSMISGSPYLSAIGSDPDEWWIGKAKVEAKRQQNQELPVQEMRNYEATAYSIGDVGWIVLRYQFRSGHGPWVSFRETVVAAKESGGWKIVHSHNSIGQSNVEALGLRLTTNIERIEQMVGQERPEILAAASSDGFVTIVFTDIEDSTKLLERLGDFEFQKILNWHDEIVRTTVATWGGQVVKSLGDGAMLAFPSPSIGLSATLEIRSLIARGRGNRHIRIRAGLHTGLALRREEDFFGRTVVIAARICALAKGGEVLVSEELGTSAQPDSKFAFGRKTATKLKGLEGVFFVRRARKCVEAGG